MEMEKINAVESTIRQPTSKYLPMLWRFWIWFKKIRKLRFCFLQRRLLIVEQNNITTGSTLTIALKKIINLSEVIIRKQNAKIFALHKLKDEGTAIYAGKRPKSYL
jgi:Fe(3+) dicitrate transport protein